MNYTFCKKNKLDPNDYPAEWFECDCIDLQAPNGNYETCLWVHDQYPEGNYLEDLDRMPCWDNWKLWKRDDKWHIRENPDVRNVRIQAK